MTNEVEMRWLVYRPVQAWDESEASYLVCDTEAKAKEVAKELQDWLEAFALTLPSTENLSGGEKVAAYGARDKMIKAAVPPYGLNSEVKNDIPYTGSTVRDGVFSYKSLPYIVTEMETQ